MKKYIVAILFITLMLCIVGCSPSTTADYVETTEADDGVYSYQSYNGAMSHSLSKIPYDMIFSSKVVPLKRVAFFENYSDHGYFPYIVVTLGRENLSDDDIYWMTKYNEKTFAKEIDINVYVYSTENEIEADSMLYVGSIYDKENIYFVFFGDKARYSYLNSEFSCQIIHTPTSITAEDTVHYYYTLEVTEGNYSDSDEVLSERERSAVKQAINNYLDN